MFKLNSGISPCIQNVLNLEKEIHGNLLTSFPDLGEVYPKLCQSEKKFVLFKWNLSQMTNESILWEFVWSSIGICMDLIFDRNLWKLSAGIELPTPLGSKRLPNACMVHLKSKLENHTVTGNCNLIAKNFLFTAKLNGL